MPNPKPAEKPDTLTGGFGCVFDLCIAAAATSLSDFDFG
jgi:hypothetical protein